jgi:hypothetical protein
MLSVVWLVGSKSVALADVQNQLTQTRTVRLIQTTKAPGQPDASERALLLADGRCRIETGEGQYTIMDTRLPKIMSVSTADKKAMILHGRPPYGPANLYDYFRNMHKEFATRLPNREIDGKQTVGFHVPVKHGPFPAVEVNIWVDPDTDLPVRMESSSKDEHGREVVQIIHNIHFDEDVDEALFEFEVPKEFTVEEHGLAPLPPLPDKQELIAPEVKPTVGLGPVRFGMTKDEVISLLGQPDSIEGNGAALAYFSRGYSIYVSPQRGVVSYSCYAQTALTIQARNFAGKTSSGVGIGSSLEDLRAAFGVPDVEAENGSLIGKRVVYHSKGLDFSLVDDKVVQFMVKLVRQSNPK